VCARVLLSEGVFMTVLRQKIEDELNALDHQSLAALYEHLRQINRLRRASCNRQKLSVARYPLSENNKGQPITDNHFHLPVIRYLFIIM
jgi:hypothetical protein